MALFNIFNIAGSGMSAESVRLNTVASNLANADSVSSSPTTAYKARYPVFQAIQSSLMSPGGAAESMPGADAAVQVRGIVESTAAGTASYQPGNPLADANGYVYNSNVNVVEQMADMIAASRSYQNDAQVLETSKSLMLDTLKIAQG
ncbi:MAG TPA: flagellar basal body rod protein FlgC [Steroidobacteraceae bacterium]|jgi:flagellar basal-body rod protein FlgC|nr:flagellar basal body rod protein FlgC [Steroidobacteraceae bacterium]